MCRSNYGVKMTGGDPYVQRDNDHDVSFCRDNHDIRGDPRDNYSFSTRGSHSLTRRYDDSKDYQRKEIASRADIAVSFMGKDHYLTRSEMGDSYLSTEKQLYNPSRKTHHFRSERKHYTLTKDHYDPSNRGPHTLSTRSTHMEGDNSSSDDELGKIASRTVTYKRGDYIVRLMRGTTLYHHGICVSERYVASFYNSKIIKETIEEFSNGENVELLYRDCNRNNREMIASRAEAYLANQNFGGYNLLSNNCEHFASACRRGKSQSSSAQADRIANSFGSILAHTVTGAWTAGLSGAVAGALYGIYNGMEDVWNMIVLSGCGKT